MFYKEIDLEYIKENLSGKGTDEDAKLVADAIIRTKKLGAKTFEDTVHTLETDIRLTRQQKENQVNTYENIIDRLTKEIHRQRMLLDEIYQSGTYPMAETMEACEKPSKVQIKIEIEAI